MKSAQFIMRAQIVLLFCLFFFRSMLRSSLAQSKKKTHIVDKWKLHNVMWNSNGWYFTGGKTKIKLLECDFNLIFQHRLARRENFILDEKIKEVWRENIQTCQRENRERKKERKREWKGAKLSIFLSTLKYIALNIENHIGKRRTVVPTFYRSY